MSTNANVFNSRVTSEALEAKFRQVFPAQSGAELIQDLYASGVIQPVIDFSSVAEGSVLTQNLQTAWDFATDFTQINNTTRTLITTTGFWKVDLNCTMKQGGGNNLNAQIQINDGVTDKPIWRSTADADNTTLLTTVSEDDFVVFLRSGDSLTATSNAARVYLSVWYRQIADVNGNLVNPLGFTFS